MTQKQEFVLLYRLIDANMNRLREGLRVAEDLLRFTDGQKSATRSIRAIRADLNRPALNAFLLRTIQARDVRRDPGSRGGNVWPERASRKNAADMLVANLQRAKESTRVLEETFRVLGDPRWAFFKRIRFRIYEAEQRALA